MMYAADDLPVVCTVCHRSVGTAGQTLGNRYYCDTHIVELTQGRRAIWRASLLVLGVSIPLIIILVLLSTTLQYNPQGSSRIFANLIVAAVPGTIWLLFLYRGAARDGDPISPLCPTIFAMGALVAAAATQPFLNELIDLDSWLGRTSPLNRFLGNILIGGFTHAALLYMVVRYTVWRTESFARRVDGVLFTSAASWGYATMLNVLLTLDRGGITLLNGSLRLLTQTTAHLTASVVLGYFLGRNRFEDLPSYYLSAGVVLAAGLDGLILYAGKELNNTRLNLAQDGFSPWPGLVFGSTILIMAFTAVYGLLNRHNALTQARLENPRE